MRLAVIGLGNMGAALLRGAMAAGVIKEQDVVAFDPNPNAASDLSIRRVKTLADMPPHDVLLVAVKPGMVADVLKAVQLFDDTLVISVAAGVSLATLRVATGMDDFASDDFNVVRCMPNLASSLGAGMTAWTSAEPLRKDHLAFMDAFFGSAGSVVELADESWMHAFTGVVGSGIAYLFLAAEAMADGAVAEGLPRPIAQQAAAAAIFGAGALLTQTELGAAEYKDRVCSPGGTTIEGITTLENHGARHAFISAVRAAAQKSRKLAGDAE